MQLETKKGKKEYIYMYSLLTANLDYFSSFLYLIVFIFSLLFTNSLFFALIHPVNFRLVSSYTKLTLFSKGLEHTTKQGKKQKKMKNEDG